MVKFDGRNFRCTYVRRDMSGIKHKCNGIVLEGEKYKDGNNRLMQELSCINCAKEYDVSYLKYMKFLKVLK